MMTTATMEAGGDLVLQCNESIDAVSKPTKKVVPSGGYDGAMMRQRIAEWAAKDAAANQNAGGQPMPASRPLPPPPMTPSATTPTKSAPETAAYPEFNEELGF